MQIPPPPKTEAERQFLREHFLEPETRCDTEISVHTKEVWKCMLDILEQFIRICDKYDLQWSVTSGTLLGAIRHGGFIPWDEDLDVTLPQKDFNTLMRVAPKELKAPFMLQNWISDRDVASSFARIRNSDTASIVESYARHHWLCNMGIFIDIYPLEGIPDGKITRKIYQWIVWNLSRTHGQSMRIPKNPPITLKDRFRLAAFRLVGPKGWFHLFNSFLALFPLEKCQMCGLTAHNFYETIWKNSQCPSRYFSNYEERDFEYLRVKVPVGWEKILATYYGNWRKFVKGTCNHEGNLYTETTRSFREVLPERYAHYGYTKEDFS